MLSSKQQSNSSKDEKKAQQREEARKRKAAQKQERMQAVNIAKTREKPPAKFIGNHTVIGNGGSSFFSRNSLLVVDEIDEQERRPAPAKNSLLNGKPTDYPCLVPTSIKDNSGSQGKKAEELLVSAVMTYPEVHVVLVDAPHGPHGEALGQQWIKDNQAAVDKARETAKKLNKLFSLETWAEFDAKLEEQLQKHGIPSDLSKFNNQIAQAYHYQKKVDAFTFRHNEVKKESESLSAEAQLSLMRSRINQLKYMPVIPQAALNQSINFISIETYKIPLGAYFKNCRTIIYPGKLCPSFYEATMLVLPEGQSITYKKVFYKNLDPAEKKAFEPDTQASSTQLKACASSSFQESNRQHDIRKAHKEVLTAISPQPSKPSALQGSPLVRSMRFNSRSRLSLPDTIILQKGKITDNLVQFSLLNPKQKLDQKASSSATGEELATTKMPAPPAP